VSLVIAFGAVAIGMLLGGTLGLVAGYLRGAWETITGSAALALLAFPPIIAVLAVGGIWIRKEDVIQHISPDSTGMVVFKTTVIIGIISAPLLFRVIYASTISFSTREFVTAARGLGASSRRIIFRELLPNVMPAIISFALVGVTLVIILEGSLAFLGLSVQPPTPSWGNMINEGRESLQNSPPSIGLTLWPVLTVVLFLLALNFMTDKIRQRFDINEGRL
jgi:peptide/nickel transport system permease protein